MALMMPLRLGILRNFGIKMMGNRMHPKVNHQLACKALAPLYPDITTFKNDCGPIREVHQYSAPEKERIMCKMPKTKFTAKIYTLPNLITFSRIALSPAMGYFICTGMYNPALVCFAIAASTDFLDGFLARRLKQESEFGTVLDPIADKILFATCLVSLYNVDTLPLMLVKSVITRDILLVSVAGYMRWLALEDKASLSNFLNFKNYPSIGYEPVLSSKVATMCISMVVMANLGREYLADIVPHFSISLTVLHIITGAFTVASCSEYALRFLETEFRTPERRFKG